MTTPANGTISLSQVRDEFGLSNPISMSQLYGKGGLQSSGAISFSDLYNRSNVAPSVAVNGNYSQSGNTTSKNMGTYSAAVSNGSASSYNWTFSNDDGGGSWSITSGQGSSSVVVGVSSVSGGGNFGTIKLIVTAVINGSNYSGSAVLQYTNNGVGCVAHDSWFPGGMRAWQMPVGASLRALDYMDMNSITTAVVRSNVLENDQCFRLTSVSGITLVTSITTPITLRNRTVITVQEALGHQLPVEDASGFRWEEIIGVEDVGFRDISHIFADNSTFAAGERPNEYIYTHNVKG